MIVKLPCTAVLLRRWFESSVNSYDSQTNIDLHNVPYEFESSVNSYDSQTK